MSKDLKSEKTFLVELKHDKELINSSFQPSIMKIFDPIERAMEPIRRQQLAIRLASEQSGALALINSFNSANFHEQNILDLATTTSRIVENMSATHQSWLDCMKTLDHSIFQQPQLQNFAELIQRDISLQLAASVRFMAALDSETFIRRFQFENQVISEFVSSIAHITTSYGTLVESLSEFPDITQPPALVLPGATREIFTSSFALKTLRTSDEWVEEVVDEEIQLVTKAEVETSDCIALLLQIDPGLAKPYIGARDALDGNNPDRVRHFLISLREMWSHLLRHLAPDNLVFTWITENPKEQGLLHKDRPTRRARVLYVLRDLNYDPLKDFLLQDTGALVKLIELFQRVHELEAELTEEQLRAIKLKSDSWLLFILKLLTISDEN